MQEALAVVVLAVVLVAAVVRPRGLPEAVIALPGAALLLATGAVTTGHAGHELARLGPVVGFLAAVLVLADACAEEGLFDAVGARIAGASRGSGSRLLAGTFAAAAITTAVLSLDTTVVLLTPIVLATARRATLSPRPHLYATAHLSNTASLLLPVSNLTNLLALAVVPVTFTRFAALMTLPWLVAIAVEYAVLRAFFRRDLAATAAPATGVDMPVPWFALGIVCATLAGFVVTSVAGVEPVWAAAAGAVVMAGKRAAERRAAPVDVVRAAAPAFCLFVLALGVIVRAASDHGLGRVVTDVLPHGASLPALLGIAAVAAVAANVVNNLPATLLLLPVAARGGLGPVLAVLVGVDIGPNLSYVGSLATLLWRRVIGSAVDVPRLGEFSALAVATVPLAMAGATVALWASLRWIGA